MGYLFVKTSNISARRVTGFTICMKHAVTLNSKRSLIHLTCSFYDKMFVVPKAEILIPVLPDKSRDTFYTASYSILFFIEFDRNFWVAGKVTSDPFSSLPERKERKGH